MEQMRAGVYCRRPSTNGRADADMVFEDVFSMGAWWGVTLELMVDGDRGSVLVRMACGNFACKIAWAPVRRASKEHRFAAPAAAIL